MYNLSFREELPEPIQRELDAFISVLQGIIENEHNEDGSHKFDFTNLNNVSVNALINAAQAKGQWWKTGPWTIDDPAGVNPNQVGLNINLAAGTYHNYAPTGIDDAVVLEINPTGAVILTGLKALDGANRKRIFMIRHSGTSNTITLSDADTGSIAAFRFALPAGEDVQLEAGQNVWLYYSASAQRWTAAITGQAAGQVIPISSGGGVEILEAFLTIDRTDINSWSTSPLTIVPAIPGSLIVPVQLSQHYYQHTGGGQWLTSYSTALRYAGNANDLMASAIIIPSSGFPLTDTFYTLNSATTSLSYKVSTFDPVNKDLVLKGSADANVGEGESTDYIEVRLLYTVVTLP